MDNKKARANRAEKTSRSIGEVTGQAVGQVISTAASAAETTIRATTEAVIGGIAGAASGFCRAIKPHDDDEDEFWQKNYRARPYVAPNDSYETFRPAYRFGWQSHSRYGGRPFEEVETQLRDGWIDTNSPMAWEAAREAIRDAYVRVEFASVTNPT